MTKYASEASLRESSHLNAHLEKASCMQDPYFSLTDNRGDERNRRSFEHENSMLFFLFERLSLDMEKFFLSAARLFSFFNLAILCSLWDLSSHTRLQNPRPQQLKAQCPHRWTTREFPHLFFIA